MKNILFFMLVLISIAPAAGCSKTYNCRINAGGLSIILKADRYPLVKGDNRLAAIIIGSGQRTITDAKVEAAFYMLSMGMPLMKSKTEAVLNGDKYFFTVTPSVEGKWKLDLTVLQAERPAVTTTFNVDTR